MQKTSAIWSQGALIVFLSTAFLLAGSAGTGAADLPSAASLAVHSEIDTYEGPQTCVACHEKEAMEMFGSVHYQWTGPTPSVPNIAGQAGKGDKGFNTYCGSVESSRHVACYGCHVGNGGNPGPTVSMDQLSNIDCMMCHQEAYERKPAPPQETVTFIDYQQVERSWRLPVEEADGSFAYMPDSEKMSISAVQAAQTVHLPTRGTCLRCHAYAAGSDCGKRGDLSTFTADPPYADEVHMSKAGADLQCQACHEFENHLTLGRGLDLRPSERDIRLTCQTAGCHDNPPHHNDQLDAHTHRVACQSCHIPAFAKLRSTEMERDWDHPFFAAGLFGGQGGFKPEEIREMFVTPTYKWYNGTSRVYARGQPIDQNSSGVYEMGEPIGSVAHQGAMIYPMKEHFSESARHDATGQLIPHSTFTYFVTGDFERAVAEGMAYAGLSGNWSKVRVHTYQTINHGVEPYGNALECGQCHSSLEGGPVRMALQEDFGYVLKGPESQVCTQCHEMEEEKPFKTIHDKHVKDKDFDCSWCHTFTRPERNLETSPDAAADRDGDGVLDGNDGCPDDPDKTAPGECGCGVPEMDSDRDGVPDCTEDGGSAGGDGNSDGIPDREQAIVACMKTYDGHNYIMLSTNGRNQLRNCCSMDLPPNPPENVHFYHGLFEFEMEDLVAGEEAILTLKISEGTGPNTYYKYGPTPDHPEDHWYEFMYDGTTGAEIKEDVILLHFQDGRRGDDDLTANGVIRDQGGPGTMVQTDNGDSGGGGNCFIQTIDFF